MAYRLYLDDLKTPPLNKWPKSRYFFDESTPLKFILNGKEKNSFKIEEIDSLLCSFKNREEFIKELKSHNISYLTFEERTKEDLVLAYNVKGQVKEAKVIFDDKLLFEQAINLRANKKNAKKGTRVLTECSDRLLNYVYFIKSLALNKTTSNYILHPKNINYLTLEEKATLNSAFLNSFYINVNQGSIKNYKSYMKLGLQALLENYVSFKKQRDELSEKGISTLAIEQEIDNVNEKIILFFREDYRNLRRMIEWESKYKEILLSCLNKEELSDYDKEIIKVQLSKIDFAKAVRNSDNVTEDDFYFLTADEEYLYNEVIDTKKPSPEPFDNPRIAEFYEYGGIESVMEQVDLDEILKSPDDARRLGIIQKTKR